jgi:hypothetical protein
VKAGLHEPRDPMESPKQAQARLKMSIQINMESTQLQLQLQLPTTISTSSKEYDNASTLWLQMLREGKLHFHILNYSLHVP